MEIKRYGMRGIKYDNGDYLLEPDIVECHDGEYVKFEDYERLKRQNEELRSIVEWCQWRISGTYKIYVQQMIDRVKKL